MNGWTKEISEAERLANEVNACIELTELFPGVEYWQCRLSAAIVAEYEYHNQPQIIVPADWPWTHEDWLSELDNYRPEVCF